jgi:hypothetical protein
LEELLESSNMATAEESHSDNRKVLTDVAPWAEVLSKGIAATAIALYVSGFLIVSLHHYRYGFVETNLFRARIVAAGAWFFLLSAFPIVSITRMRILQISWLQLALFSYPYYGFCLVLSLMAAPIFSFSINSPWLFPAPHAWRWVLITIVLIGLMIFLIDWKKSPRIVTAIASVSLVLFYLSYPARDLIFNHQFPQSAIALWFFAVGFVTAVELKSRQRGGDWEKTVIPFLGTLFVFAFFYYPHIQAAWGGGTPIGITIYFTKDSAIKPGQAVSAQLIEESDGGLYIVGPNETNAIFVPRSAVGLVYFSDRIADSPLLRDNK